MHKSSGRKGEEGAASEFFYDSVVKYTPHSCRGSSLRKHATTKGKTSEEMARVAMFPFNKVTNKNRNTRNRNTSRTGTITNNNLQSNKILNKIHKG